MRVVTVTPYLCMDGLFWMVFGLASIIGLVTLLFGIQHITGKAARLRFLIGGTGALVALILLSAADALILFALTWVVLNLCLYALMNHAPRWRAARASASLLGRYLAASSLLLAIGFLILNHVDDGSLKDVVQNASLDPPVVVALLCILMAAGIQMALWPAHKWLMATLNAPTPSMVIIQVPIIGAGVILMVRFAPLYVETASVLWALFTVGVFTSTLATLWSLIQNDVRRMLAYAAMAQMAFAAVLCGLGLFRAAMLHLCAFGLWQMYRLLSANAPRRPATLSDAPPQFGHVLSGLVGGVMAAYIFSSLAGYTWWANDTTRFLSILVIIGGTQMAIAVTQALTFWGKLPLAWMVSASAGGVYGFALRLTMRMMPEFYSDYPSPLYLWHMLGVIVMLTPWLLMFFRQTLQSTQLPDWVLRVYVFMWNAGQPPASTITPHRNPYHLKAQ